MPIRPENRRRYPPDWRQIVARVRARSRNRCEGSPAYPQCRAPNGKPHPVTGSLVVLTVGHLDHTPEHCDLENLRDWCQRCHLTYDAKHHAQTAYMNRRCRFTLDLFEPDYHDGAAVAGPALPATVGALLVPDMPHSDVPGS